MVSSTWPYMSIPCSKAALDCIIVASIPATFINTSGVLLPEGVPQWSTGTGLGPVGLVPAWVRIPAPSLWFPEEIS